VSATADTPVKHHCEVLVYFLLRETILPKFFLRKSFSLFMYKIVAAADKRAIINSVKKTGVLLVKPVRGSLTDAS